MVGPPFLNNLCAMLLRFCISAFAVSTDIEKAFFHVKLQPSDRNFTKFLWPPNPDDEFHTYRFNIVPFGSASSPFLLAAVLKLHLSKFNNKVATNMKDNLYVLAVTLKMRYSYFTLSLET